MSNHPKKDATSDPCSHPPNPGSEAESYRIMKDQSESTTDDPELASDALLGVSVLSVGPDTANYEPGCRITLKRKDGKTFSVNIPDSLWGCGYIHGLNMVFDHSGEGDHYI